MTDPYERMKIPTRPTQPWQLRHKWLVVLIRFVKLVFCIPYAILYFPIVWPFMLTIGYLFHGSAMHYVRTEKNIWSDFYMTRVDQHHADWSFWNWGELEKEKKSND